MADTHELESLRQRKKNLGQSVLFCKQKKEEVIKIKRTLDEQFNWGKISEQEHLEQLNSALGSRSFEEWIKYYDNLVSYYLYQIRLCDKLIKEAKYSGFGRILLPVLVALIIFVLMIIAVSLFIILRSVDFSKEISVPEKISEAKGILGEQKLDLHIVPKNAEIVSEGKVEFSSVVAGKNVSANKRFRMNKDGEFNFEIPKGARVVAVRRLENGRSENVSDLASVQTKGIFNRKTTLDFNGAGITGKAVQENFNEGVEYEVVLELPGPTLQVEAMPQGNKVTIEGPDYVTYTNVLASVELPREIASGEEQRVRVNNLLTGEEMRFSLYDNDLNGLLDSVEWVANSTGDVYGVVIEISKAEHLDENKTFISDIYEQVKARDNLSAQIPDGHYVRAGFSRNLTDKNDITIYARAISGSPRVEVYEFNKSEKIAEFSEISDGVANKILLTNLTYEQDWFDLKVIDGEIDVDYIVDPIGVINISVSYPVAYAVYVSNVLSFNYSTDATKSCWYSVNGGANSSAVAAGTNFSVNYEQGRYNLSLYCNNSDGTYNKADVRFIVWNFNNASFVNKLGMPANEIVNPYDNFGYSVSISGDYAVITAFYDDNPFDNNTAITDAGAAYVYRKNSSGQFDFLNKLGMPANEIVTDSDYFGYSVSISGDYAVVGAMMDDHPFNNGSAIPNAGAAYVYKKNATGQFDFLNKLGMPANEIVNTNDNFGVSVSISGNYAVVGAWNDDHPFDNNTAIINAGAAYVYKKNATGQFDFLNKLGMPANEIVNLTDAFGYSVSISGDYAVISAFYDDHPFNNNTAIYNAGAAYVYKKNATGQFDFLNKLGMPTNEIVNISDYFGVSVSISGDYAVVGTLWDDHPFNNNTAITDAGAAFVYKKNSSGQYDFLNKLGMPANELVSNSDSFGTSVSNSGDYAVVGAYGENHPFNNNTAITDAGAVFVYKKNSSGQYDFLNKLGMPLNEIVNSSDNLGRVVSISGDYVVGGAYGDNHPFENNTAITDAGAAYLFKLNVSAAPAAPNLSITYPVPYAAYVSNMMSFNYSTDASGVCWFSVNGGANSSNVAAGTNFSVNYGQGRYNLSLYCNNSYGVYNKIDISFIVGDFNNASYINKLGMPSNELVNASDFFGYSISVSGDYAVVGANKDDHPFDNNTAIPDTGAAYVYKRNSSGQFDFLNKLGMPANELINAGDRFGYSVSVSGDYAVVGANRDDHPFNNNTAITDAGAAYVYKKNSSGQFEFLNKLGMPGNEIVNISDFFGIFVSVSGDYAVVGANYDDHPFDNGSAITDAGAAYVYKKNSSGQFEFLNKLGMPGNEIVNISDFFGRAVSISGNYIIVGAYLDEHPFNNNTAITDAGAAYIYKKNSSGQFEFLNKLGMPSNEIVNTSDSFGVSVSVSGDYAVVGAPGDNHPFNNNTAITDAGAAYVYKKNLSGQFEFLNKLGMPSNEIVNTSDDFGWSVFISGDYVAVGAYFDDHPFNNDTAIGDASAAYVYKKNSSGQFEFLNKLGMPMNEIVNISDYFGFSVSISGDYVAVAAPYDEHPFNNNTAIADAGAAYLYELNYTDLIAPDINFTSPTPADGSAQTAASIFVNVTANDSVSSISTFIDFDNSLVSWWRMDDLNSSGGVVDYMGRNNGTPVGGAGQTAAGKMGKGFSFDGVDDYIIVNDSNSLNNYKQMSIFWWAKYSEPLIDYSRFFSKASDWNDGSYYSHILGPTYGEDKGKIVIFFFNSTSRQDLYSKSKPSFNNWHHFAAVYDSIAKNATLYIDGSFDSNISIFGDINSSSHNLVIGSGMPLTYYRYYNGLLDDILIFNRSLSAAEVSALYANSSVKYVSNNFSGLSQGAHSFKAYAQDAAGNVNKTEQRVVTLNIDIPPQIISVEAASQISPLEGGFREVKFNFTAFDFNGFRDIDSSSARANFTKSTGGELRSYTSCGLSSQWGSYYANYTCIVPMGYYDSPGIWNISVEIADFDNNYVMNLSANFSYRSLDAWNISEDSAQLSFANVAVNPNLNRVSSKNLTLNNLGNTNIVQSNITAFDLAGESISSQFMRASWFSAAPQPSNPCVGSALANATPVISGFSLNRGFAASRNLSFCLRGVDISQGAVSGQVYSTKQTKNSWVLDVIFGCFVSLIKLFGVGSVLMIAAIRRKSLLQDNLVVALVSALKEMRTEYSEDKQKIVELLIKEIKRKNRISNSEIRELVDIDRSVPVGIFRWELGELEAIVKFLKENLNLSYKEISDLIGRNERTIWSAYHQAQKKKRIAFKILSSEVFVPMEEFKRGLTVFEALVIFLKRKKDMSFAEIGKLINRDSRNIWATYKRAERKIAVKN